MKTLSSSISKRGKKNFWYAFQALLGNSGISIEKIIKEAIGGAEGKTVSSVRHRVYSF